MKNQHYIFFLCYNVNRKLTGFALIVLAMCFNISVCYGNDMHRTMVIKFQNITLSKKSIVKFNAFVNGGDIVTLSSDTVSEETNRITFKYNIINSGFAGIGEIVVEGTGAFPVIIGDTVQEIIADKNDLKNYTAPPFSDELKALGIFLPVYHGYEKMLSQYREIMISSFGRYTSDTMVYTHFINDYTSFRKQFNLLFKYTQTYYKHTYVANTLSKMFVQNNSMHTWLEARAAYFHDWDFTDSNLLNNPLFDRQLDIYNFIVNTPCIKNDEANIDALYGPVTACISPSRSLIDHIYSYSVIHLFQQNINGIMDKTIAYLYRRWLSNGIEHCNEEADKGTEALFQKAFYKRLANIGNVAEGLQMPDVSGYDKDKKKISIQSLLSAPDRKPYLLLFIWSSSCTHCEAYAPMLEVFAKQHEREVQVLSYSIDKKNNENSWKENIKRRIHFQNWIDIAEINDMESQGISRICYMGTPGVFLLNKQGIIVSKTTDLKLLAKSIK